MIVEWTESALADLEGIHNQIARDSAYYAQAVVDRLTRRCLQIEAFPYSGQMVPEYQRADIREVFEYSYRLIYQVSADTTWILAVLHGASTLPDSPPEEKVEP
ncbi:type II toxin-antitoxin system RelE/ParE family toxin [Stieleria sedimenti]|uniref:type II toxin-antitoxin system RelE/ParE family toxin n=1 Tax=Stieleria sedimenti TaxID=2976331 RepID=UPI00389B2BF4